MPARKNKRRAAKPMKAARAKVIVTYHHRAAAPDRHFHTKRALAYIVFAVALAVGITAFYDAAYYTGLTVLPTGPTYTLAAADGSGGTASSGSYKLSASIGEAMVGEGSSTGFKLVLGAMGFLGGDSTAPVCTITQGTGTPGKGIANTLTATCTDDTELAQITLYTDEGGVMATSSTYGSPTTATGTEKSAAFEWNNPQIAIGKTITWKVSATDTSGNVGESATLAFTVGAVADTFKPTVGVPTATPAMPKEGETVSITAQVSDDTALASANLIVGTTIAGSAPVSGKSATASFTWTAGKAGAYTIKVKATDAAGNTADSPPLTITVGSGICDQATKPADIVGECKGDVQIVTTYECDSATGQWTPVTDINVGPCAPASPIAFIAVGLVALVIAAAAAAYIVKKKPEMFAKLKAGKGDKGKKVQPPATFG